MGEIARSIDVKADLRTVYDQWTQFEEFPRFMKGVRRVDQIDDRRLHWAVDVAGVEREFEAVITDQGPDERIAWMTTSGVAQSGVVTFHRLGYRDTRVTLQMDFDPQGFVEQIGEWLGLVARRTQADLERFKAFIEERQVATVSWRGETARDRVKTKKESNRTGEGEHEGTVADLASLDLGEAEAWAHSEGVDGRQGVSPPRPEDHDGGMRRFGG